MFCIFVIVNERKNGIIKKNLNLLEGKKIIQENL